MSDTYTGDVHCMKCKDKRHVENAPIVETANGRHMVKGTCPECGTTVTRFIKK